MTQDPLIARSAEIADNARFLENRDIIEKLKARYALPDGVKRCVLLARGGSGSRWFFDERKMQWILVDPYTENVAEALAEWCAENGWRLTVFFEGLRPTFSGERRPYSEKYPGVADEMYSDQIRPAFYSHNKSIELFDEHYHDTLGSDPAFADAFAYRGVSLFDTLTDQTRLIPILSGKFVSTYQQWRTILDILKPEVLFGGRLDIRADINLAAHLTNVKTVGVKLGISEEMLTPFALTDGEGEFYQSIFPDVTAVWGEHQKALIEERFPDCTSVIVVSGRTRNDSFVSPDASNAQAIDPASTTDGAQGDMALGEGEAWPSPAAIMEPALPAAVIEDPQPSDEEEYEASLRGRLDLPRDARLIVYGANFQTKYGVVSTANYGACCMSRGSYTSGLLLLEGLARARGDVSIIVKPHPSDDIEFVKKFVAELNSPKVRLVTDADGVHNAKLLRESELFVSSVSSMFAEAVLSDCAAVNLWTPDINYLYELQRREIYGSISTTANGLDELVPVVERLLDDHAFREAELESARQALSHIFGGFDGGNAWSLVEQSMAAIGFSPRGNFVADEVGQ